MSSHQLPSDSSRKAMSTHLHTLLSPRLVRRIGVAVLTAAFTMVNFEIGAQRADQLVAVPNFDVRTARDATASAYVAGVATRAAFAGAVDLPGAWAAGLGRLQSTVGAVDVVTSPELGTP